ncbi:hypothetical protein AHF37_05811 [Paragonimus kellicotti]|nr:hypothetical protein AHF37_05811 [Paragonimus kellicotti]
MTSDARSDSSSSVNLDWASGVGAYKHRRTSIILAADVVVSVRTVKLMIPRRVQSDVEFGQNVLDLHRTSACEQKTENAVGVTQLCSYHVKVWSGFDMMTESY